MAKKTALDAALEREQRTGPKNGKLAASLVFALAVGLCAGSLLQAAAVFRDHRAEASMGAARERMAAGVKAAVEQRTTEIRTALADPQIARRANPFDPELAARAASRLRAKLPSFISADFYRPDLAEILSGDLAAFGYARANALTEARTGTRRAHLVPNGDGYALAIVEPVVRDGETTAFAYVVTDAKPVLDAFSNAGASGGRAQLFQGTRALAAAGDDSVAGSAEPIRVDVPNSTLAIETQAAQNFRIGEALPILASDSIGRLVAMAVVFGLLALGAYWWRLGRPMPKRSAAGDAASSAGALGRLRNKLKGKDSVSEEQDQIMPAEPERAVAAASAASAAPTPVDAKPALGGAVDRSIFRAYDIRGVVDKTLTVETARLIGQAIGTVALERGLKEVVVGRDGRLSGPTLAGALSNGLRAAGVDVIDIGAVPTPVLYFATYSLNVGSGVSVTGSHNPPDYNGFKIMLGGETLAEDSIQDLYSRIVEGRLATGNGGLQVLNVIDSYVERIANDIQLERPLKVVVDAGNGIAGGVGPAVLRAIGCEVEELYCEVDGKFPNHHPDPSDPHNLKDLILAVKTTGAHVGLAFDGDGDRLGVVTAEGEIVYPDRLLMLFAIDVLTRAPGAPIIYDVKCTGHLQDVILRHGGSPIMWKTGHSLIKAKMKQEDAELAGEMSGHFFFRERWFGFDDGIYSAARLCEILATRDETPQEIFNELPKGVSTPELKINMEEGAHYAYIQKFREKSQFPGARITTIDGVRADYADGWGLVRCSNTTPCLVLRFDADSSAALTRIQEAFRTQILAIDPSLKLPF